MTTQELHELIALSRTAAYDKLVQREKVAEQNSKDREIELLRAQLAQEQKSKNDMMSELQSQLSDIKSQIESVKSQPAGQQQVQEDKEVKVRFDYEFYIGDIFGYKSSHAYDTIKESEYYALLNGGDRAINSYIRANYESSSSVIRNGSVSLDDY